MRIWIDLGNSPHIHFFLPLAKEFERRGYEVLWTARDYAQTVPLARKAGLPIEIFGTHGGKNILNKGVKFAWRVKDLFLWARNKKIDLAISHNSHEPLAVARLLGIDSVNLMDYEFHPMNKLSFRLAKRLIVPKSFSDDCLKKLGVADKTLKFDGIKEDVYLANFEPDPKFAEELKRLGITPENILVVIRPHAPEALYHRGFKNEILDRLPDDFAAQANVKVILLPRNAAQAAAMKKRHRHKNIIIPEDVLDGKNLAAAADLVVSGGGTMSREAAALGVPAITVFAGELGKIDEYLLRENRLRKIEDEKQVSEIKLEKKAKPAPRQKRDAFNQVANFILDRRN